MEARKSPRLRRERPKRSVYRRIRISMITLGGLAGLVFPLLVGHMVLDLAESALYTTVCTVACLAVGCGAYVLFNVQVSREIHRIVGAMQKINRAVEIVSETGEEWDDRHHLQISSDDDIGDVEIAFNEMTAAIGRRLNLEYRNRHLQTSLARSIEPREVSTVILEEIMDTSGAVGGVIYVNTGASFERMANVGIDNTERLPLAIDSTDGPVERAFAAGEIVEISPDTDGLDWVQLTTPFGSFRPRSVVLVPLESNEEPVGLVCLAARTEELSGEKAELLESLRNRAGQYLQNAILHEKLQKLAALDELTGLLNRRFGSRRLQEEFSIALRHGIPFSVMMVDIDHFKSFNDTFGHDAGDAVLRRFAAILERNVRAGDVVCRYGGEEFLVAAPGTGVEGATGLAERLRQTVDNDRVRWRDQELRVSISTGVATWPVSRASSPDELVTIADRALYYAKNNGRNRVAVHDGDQITTVRSAPADDESQRAA